MDQNIELEKKIKRLREAYTIIFGSEEGQRVLEDISMTPETVTNVKLPTTNGDQADAVNELEKNLARPQINNVEIPETIDEPVINQMSDVEIEFRALVTELIEAGIEPVDMMDDPRWEDISERATANGFETWPVFLELTAME